MNGANIEAGTILINMEPGKIKGVESKGMILVEDNATGELSFLLPSSPMNNESKVS